MNNFHPKLFGLNQSNRDFSKKESWGKNQFNSSFPAALACYMDSKSIDPVYLTLDKNLKIIHGNIKVSDIFKISPSSDTLFFAFERDYSPYQQMVVGNLPRVDLVTMDTMSNSCLQAIEIKMTALPDDSTCELKDASYGCEIVVRPPTIIYLGLAIAKIYEKDHQTLFNHLYDTCKLIEDWTIIDSVLPKIVDLANCLDLILSQNIHSQKPLIMQQVWKTQGKSAELNDNCLDIFVWSDFALTRLFIDITRRTINAGIAGKGINRHMRSLVWLSKILYEFAKNKIVNYRIIIDKLTYNTKNDKAFSVNGIITNFYMSCQELTAPRIKKSEIKNIITGGGEKLLSPERRFDAIILNTPNLF